MESEPRYILNEDEYGEWKKYLKDVDAQVNSEALSRVRRVYSVLGFGLGAVFMFVGLIMIKIVFR